MKEKDCLFCKFASNQLACHKVWEDEKHLAFLTIYPNTEGYTVVITKDHHDSYAFNNSDEVLANLVLATKKVAKLIDKAYEGDVGRTGMFFEGFGVDHLHSKLWPMHGTAAAAKDWQPIDSDIADQVYPAYPGFMASNNGPRVSDEELARVAERIRSAGE